MSSSDRVSVLAGSERGAVLVFFALFAPVAILLATLAIDTSNWFVHKRHLQVQADAGALAAAQGFQPCENEVIYKQASQYSGVKRIETPGGPVTSAVAESELYNAQPNTQERLHELINSQSYYNESGPADSSAVHKPPCEAEMVDVKLTETNLPWYMRALSVPYINAHARVEINQETQTSGTHFIPVALADSNPRSAEACFVNEEPEAPVKEAKLEPRSSSGGLEHWESVAAAVKIAPHVAVRVALSGSATTTCTGTDTQRVFYDTSGAGVLHIQGWTGNGTGGEGGSSHPKPIAREVQLINESCADAYFSALKTGATCTVGVSATVEGLTNQTLGVKVTAEVSGVPSVLSYVSGTGKWTGRGISVAAEAGSVPVNIVVTDTAMQGLNKEKAISFKGIQRTYTTSSAKSGPIQSAEAYQVGKQNELLSDANSFQRCETGHEGAACEPNLVVKVSTAGLENAKGKEDEPIVFPARWGITNCLPGTSFKQRLADGCEGTYAINKGAPCTTSPPVITCVQLKSGETTQANDFAAGLNMRILDSESVCTAPNHWSMYPELPANDPRIVTIVVVPFGAGPGTWPILNFGTFYITGWAGQGQGFTNPCQPPGGGDDPAPSGGMVGHFITYVNTTDTGGGGTTTCEPNAFGQCVAVLTR